VDGQRQGQGTSLSWAALSCLQPEARSSFGGQPHASVCDLLLLRPCLLPLPCCPCLQAFEKNPKDGDTLANLVAVSLHLGKPASRYQSQLKLVAPAHALVRRSEEGEAAFDRAAASAVTA
jgi:hypothetical protein